MKLYETITAENWAKYFPMQDNSGCVYSHLLAMDLRSGTDRRILNDLAEIVRLLFPERVYARDSLMVVGDFNDHPDTTVEDVIRVCKVADV